MWCRLIGVWLSVSLSCASCSTQRDLHYESLADAVAAGETARGWIPEWVPTDARAIRLTYDVSSPRTWCMFELPPGRAQLLGKELTSDDVPPPSVRRIRNPGVRWWPDFLTGELDVVGLRRRGIAVYTVDEPGGGTKSLTVVVAVDVANGRAYFYRSSGG